ncbi:MAG: hypothetical protein IJZ30_03230 [Alphaproteobacteria bacterium]|nr:hypothetical protein [Alphaproteobacteria bacterium]
MSTLKLTLLCFIVLAISSCSQVRPFEDRQREPGTVYIYKGSSKPGKPAICYNSLFYEEAEIKEMADDLCKKYQANTKAKLLKVDSFSCRLFVPSKAYYQCDVEK